MISFGTTVLALQGKTAQQAAIGWPKHIFESYWARPNGKIMDEVRSINGVSVRLTEERWEHITSARDDLVDRSADVLDAIQSPDWVTKGYRGSLVAWKGYGKRGYLAVINKELNADDGFIITAFFTKKPKKRGKIWPK